MSSDVEFPPSPHPAPAAGSAAPLVTRGAAGEVIDPARPVTAHERGIDAGFRVAPHSHPRAQLLMVLSGVMRIEAGADVWVVPSGHAAWIPCDLSHQVEAETDMRTRNLHVDPSVAGHARTEAHCAVLRCTPLLEALAARLSETGAAGSDAPDWQRLAMVLLDEVARLEESDLRLPGGRDPRLRRLTRHLNRHPADPRGLSELAQEAGCSDRTLARLMPAETGLTFRQWRMRQRMLMAMTRLERGQSSAEVARALGYRSASAFIAAFRRTMGAAPGQVLRDLSRR